MILKLRSNQKLRRVDLATLHAFIESKIFVGDNYYYATEDYYESVPVTARVTVTIRTDE